MIQAQELVAKFRYALDNKWGYIWGTSGILWTEAKQKQKINYMVSNFGADWKKNAEAKDSNYYRAAVYGSKWINHYVADCSGMFVWAFKQYGLAMSHISSNIYKSYCTAKKGRLTAELKKSLPPGAAVFTGSTAANHPHVGLYVGNGKVIEAHGTEAGVCTANISENRWTWYGLLKEVSYPDVPETEPAKDDGSLPTLRRGDKGPYVTKAQTELAQRGYSLGSAGIDGDFGPATESAVKKFQKDWGLDQDGVIGPKTWAMLTTAPVKEKSYSVTVKGLTASQAKALCNEYKNSSMKEE